MQQPQHYRTKARNKGKKRMFIYSNREEVIQLHMDHDGV